MNVNAVISLLKIYSNKISLNAEKQVSYKIYQSYHYL